jgi:hypothetical protein
VPTETWESILRERGGFEIHEAAQQFLAEFGGLVNDEWPPGPITAQSPFRLDPLTAGWDEETFARLSAEAGADLYPIGQANRRTSYLGVAADGAVYIGKDRSRLLASTPSEALEQLVETQCADTPLPLVPLEPPPTRNPRNHQEMSTETGQRWSAETGQVLLVAGWYPGRSAPTATWESILREHDGFEIHKAAQQFLSEFGALAVERGQSQPMAWREFRLDPLLAKWDHEIFEVLSEEVGTDLYPLGMADRRNQYLGMARDGKVYVGMDYVSILADTGDKALEKLIKGNK